MLTKIRNRFFNKSVHKKSKYYKHKDSTFNKYSWEELHQEFETLKESGLRLLGNILSSPLEKTSNFLHRSSTDEELNTLLDEIMESYVEKNEQGNAMDDYSPDKGTMSINDDIEQSSDKKVNQSSFKRFMTKAESQEPVQTTSWTLTLGKAKDIFWKSRLNKQHDSDKDNQLNFILQHTMNSAMPINVTNENLTHEKPIFSQNNELNDPQHLFLSVNFNIKYSSKDKLEKLRMEHRARLDKSIIKLRKTYDNVTLTENDVTYIENKRMTS